MTNLRIATVVAALTVAIVCGVTSNLVLVKIVGEVNERLSEKERFLEAFWYPGKVRRLLSRHIQLVPHSKLRMVWLILVAIMMGCLLSIACMLGFFSR
jgi:hypothetical protein